MPGRGGSTANGLGTPRRGRLRAPAVRGCPRWATLGIGIAAALLTAACGSVTPFPSSGSATATSAGSQPNGSGTTSSAGSLPIGTFADGLAAELLAPQSMPPGMDDWNCKPTAAHPYPVILVHGTFANEAFSWQALSPMLADAGYCVFGFNYGADAETFGRFYGLGDIATSASQLAAFVDRVLAATGASKVDIVGHSQGGMMPRWYVKFLGGASKVNMLVGLAASNHGSTADGITALITALEHAGFPTLSELGCVACQEQVAGSSFLEQLNAGSETVPGPKFVQIESRYDEVVTPYTSAFLTGPADQVQNITLQDQCPTDYTEHIGIIYDPVALQDVMNALGPDNPNFRPRCSLVLPVASG
jgi:triacylglycerol esterase/lipase EstA (alpha/beta hydrolase family)